ncbi:hypothetical protein J437_LFUL007846 [Ladona fulva]|uniref:HTH psq-type domain-containing protein n=1 Tax=Ladona fulva TaxID=123851 RepID=A0A8K0K3I4_LADFU|nr:hypothetical protein J437_LFUL007846 [Ladona fulva]
MSSKRTCKNGDVSAKRRHKVMSLGEKAIILDKLKSGTSVAEISREYGVNESTIRYIKRAEDKIRKSVSVGHPLSAKLSFMSRNTRLEKMEGLLKVWIEDMKQKTWRSFDILKAIELIKHSWDEVPNSTMNASWQKIWPEIVLFKKFTDTDNEICKIIELARMIGEEGFKDLKEEEVRSIIYSHQEELTNDELMETLLSSSSEEDEMEHEESTLTVEALSEILKEVGKVKDKLTDIDPSMERSLKFKMDIDAALAPYVEIYKSLRRPGKHRKITQFLRPPSYENEFFALQKNIKEVTKSLENTVADKTEVINRLAKSLEESQARCEQLMSSRLGQENFELRMQLSVERSEKEAMQEKIDSLKKNIQILQADMHNYESLSHFGLLNSESVKDNDSLHQLGLSGRGQLPAGSVDPIADLNGKLKDELKRSLVGQRMKREEIKRLQMELESKDLQIKEMQLQESKYLAEAENFKAQTQQLLQHLQKEALGSTGDTKLRQIALEKEVSSLKEEIKHHKDEKKAIISVQERLEKENSELNSQNMKLSNQVEEISKIKEKEKMDAINQFQDEYLNFHDKAIARLRAEKNVELEKELNELRKQLEEAQKEAVEAKTTYLELLKDKSRKSDGSDIVNILRLELAEEREAFEKFKENHENLVQQKCNLFKSENDKYMKEVEEKSRLLYEKKVNEEIEKAKRETLRELENHYKIQTENNRKELQEEMTKKLEFEVSKIRKEIMKETVHTKEPDEKTTELFRECCRLREELKSKQDDWQKEIEKIKHEAERDKLEKLREQQKEIEERLGNEFREQLKKAESTRDQAAKMLKEQLEAEQRAFLEQYEEKLHEFSLKVKSQSTRSIGTSPTNLDEMTVVRLDEVDGTGSDKTDGMISKMVAEAVHKVRVEEEAKYAGNLEAFRSLMEKKAQEVEGMKNAMATERNRLMSALVEVKNAASEAELKTRRAYEDILKNKDSEIKKLKEQVILLSKEIEMIDSRASKEKDMMAEVMARWASEVKELKQTREEEEKQLMHVYKKYKDIKKTVAAYKLSKEEQFKNEHRKLVEHFNQALASIEEKMKDACTKHDASQAHRIAAIEASFEKKAEELLKKQDRLRASDVVL